MDVSFRLSGTSSKMLSLYKFANRTADCSGSHIVLFEQQMEKENVCSHAHCRMQYRPNCPVSSVLIQYLTAFGV